MININTIKDLVDTIDEILCIDGYSLIDIIWKDSNCVMLTIVSPSKDSDIYQVWHQNRAKAFIQTLFDLWMGYGITSGNAYLFGLSNSPDAQKVCHAIWDAYRSKIQPWITNPIPD